jgi:hypothetical protein
VSVVSHGQAALIVPLLRQLDALSSDSIDHVVLTLNLPEAFSAEGLNLRFPLTLITNPVPKGFGCNHNQAFRLCRTPWFLVLNPDIDMQTDPLLPLLRAAKEDTGLMAPLVWEPGSAEATAERDVLTPWEILAGPLRLRRPPAQPVWFAGMFMLFRSQAFQALAGFDERYHMYCEDFDVCARLSLAGWSLQRHRGVAVLHLAQRHSHVRVRYLLWHLQSFWLTWTSQVVWRYRKVVRARQPHG